MTDNKSTPATPRNLDPKFKDAEVPADRTEETDPVDRYDGDRTTKRDDAKESRSESPDEVRARMASGEVANDPGEGDIVMRRQVVDAAGNVVEKLHGPMPRKDWAAYSAKNGL